MLTEESTGFIIEISLDLIFSGNDTVNIPYKYRVRAHNVTSFFHEVILQTELGYNVKFWCFYCAAPLALACLIITVMLWKSRKIRQYNVIWNKKRAKRRLEKVEERRQHREAEANTYFALE